MKPLKLTTDILGADFANLGRVALRVAKIRGIDNDEEGDDCEKTNQEPEETSGGSVCIIPIRGVMMRDCRGWFPWATDTEEIEEMLGEAENDNNVSAVVLDIDSPGGCVNGTVELADFVAGMTKPVVAYVSGMAASAAYWVASSCDAITIRKSANVGSVGVYSAILDVTAMFEQLGVKVELFKSGENKAVGYPGTTLTDEQRSVIQSEIDRIGDQFRTHVVTYRPEIELDLLDGRCVAGELAVATGFADEIASGITSAVSTAQALGSM